LLGDATDNLDLKHLF